MTVAIIVLCLGLDCSALEVRLRDVPLEECRMQIHRAQILAASRGLRVARYECRPGDVPA